MNITDLVIIIFLLFGGLIGYKQGFTKSLVNCIGYIVIVVLAFVLKDPIGTFMMLNFPFFDFFGLIKGASVVNILIYEVLAFFIVFSILLIVLKFLLVATTIFEKILSMTIILGIPSKILGAIVGIIKNYIIVFVVLYVLALPTFSNLAFIKSSEYKNVILENTPVLSLFTSKTTMVIREFSVLTDKYKDDTSSNEYNLEAIDLFLKYDVVDVDTIEKLVDQNKLHVNNINDVLKKYKEA